jgi:predicted PhzF superfamily epimerase YddE/YHI9
MSLDLYTVDAFAGRAFTGNPAAVCLLAGPREADLAYQASARGGVLRVRVLGERVRLGGQAVTILAGRLLAG